MMLPEFVTLHRQGSPCRRASPPHASSCIITGPTGIQGYVLLRGSAAALSQRGSAYLAGERERERERETETETETETEIERVRVREMGLVGVHAAAAARDGRPAPPLGEVVQSGLVFDSTCLSPCNCA
eukprot:GHVU01227938.1.p1 GENE.GHVU01227938.1~~GHVU01227938.1.p1  ORF type:complete len:128 (-),score=14.16 GHVU01227938.1:165-548(-)